MVDQLSRLLPTSIPDSAAVAPVEQKEYLINGYVRRWEGASQDVFSPIMVKGPDGSAAPLRLGKHPVMDAAAATECLEAAKTAYDNGSGMWPMMPLEDRIHYVLNFTRAMVERREEIVRMICLEICKTRPDAEAEFDRTVKYIHATIASVKRDHNESKFVDSDGTLAIVGRSPLGICMCLGPFNYPLNETFTTLIPAIIMGNVVVFKPPRIGVLLLRPLLECFKEFPPGVVNTVYGGNDVVQAVMEEGSVNALLFIGTKRGAKAIMAYHPDPNRLLCVLGLQAKNVGVILPCADIKAAAKGCAGGGFKYNGQRCTALKLLMVHDSIATEFLRCLCEEADQLDVGMPWEKVSNTPLAEGAKAIAYMVELITDATGNGAHVSNANGNIVGTTMMTPTVMAWVTSDMRLWREEQFGPVLPVARYGCAERLREFFGTDLRKIAEYHHASPYGQQVSIFGTKPREIAKAIDLLANQVSRININCECQRGPDILPFTGRKDSATGTLSVSAAPRVLSIERVIGTPATDANKKIIEEIVRGTMSKALVTDWIF